MIRLLRVKVLLGIGLGCQALYSAAAVVDLEAPVSSSDGGAVLFAEHCAGCHSGSIPRAPHFITFNMMSSAAVLKAMNDGVMQQQAAALSPSQRIAIAEYLSESSASTAKAVLMCDDDTSLALDDNFSSWRGWGGDTRNHRYLTPGEAGLDAKSVTKLSLKWAFAYPGATRARSQPLVHGETVFVGSQDGTVYALDLNTGCAHWTYQAGAEVRNGLSIAAVASVDAPVLFFGDFKARVHAVDASSGRAIWTKDVATHPDATITGSVKVDAGRVYVPISSSEWATAADPGYACCTFRGSVAALEAGSGDLLWNTFVIPEQPVDTGTTNSMGAKRFAPSGAPVWNSPSIDRKRGLLYVGTGESYTSPASASSDAVIAIRLEDGGIEWRQQLLSGDAWNMACFIGGGGNCPEENGPDLDIGAATILWQSAAQDLLLVGQKSGDVYALNAQQSGEIVWHRKVGRGGFAGGVHWGMSTDGDTLFVPVADTDFLGLAKGAPFPGIHALDPISGDTRWYTRVEDTCPAETKPECDPGMSAAITSTRGLVFAGGFDGKLRAYETANGSVLWEFNTANVFTAVNGDDAQGGSIESDGPVIANGHVLINSGYGFGSRMPGNALLVFAPDVELSEKESASE